MSPPTALLDQHRNSAYRRLIAFTAVIMFFDGLAVVYRFHLREVNHQQMGLTPINEFAYVFGTILFEPVLLFVVLYYIASRFDGELPVRTLVPGLAGAVLLGGIVGKLVGIDTWPSFTAFGIVSGSNILVLHPLRLLYWQDVLSPIVRGLLTAIAALGLAQTRD